MSRAMPGSAIQGIELAGKRHFDFLPARFDSLGALGNVKLAEGKTDVLFSSTAVSLPDGRLSAVSSSEALGQIPPLRRIASVHVGE